MCTLIYESPTKRERCADFFEWRNTNLSYFINGKGKGLGVRQPIPFSIWKYIYSLLFSYKTRGLNPFLNEQLWIYFILAKETKNSKEWHAGQLFFSKFN